MTEAKKGGGVLGFLSKVGVIDLHDDDAPPRDTPTPAVPRNTPLPQASASFLAASQQGAPDPAVLDRLEKPHGCPGRSTGRICNGRTARAYRTAPAPWLRTVWQLSIA